MSKWLQKLRKIRLGTYCLAVLCLIALIQLLFSHGHYRYDHIPREMVTNKLFMEVNPNIVMKRDKQHCKYDNVVNNMKSINSWEYGKVIEQFVPKGIINGSFTPEDCNSQISVAILVTYRNRQKQLDTFIPYMHNFLRKQNIHYKIYVIEQQDTKPWNKGLLYNIGAKQAISDKFPCLILHDVDLLPLDEGNLYACLQQPRHLSASIDKFRYVLIYDYLVGGVLAIQSDQYIQINGFSNRFIGWGGEDDDFANRLEAHNLEIWRLPQSLSRYTMLVHSHETKNTDRHRIMTENEHRAASDGLNSVWYDVVTVKPQRLFTLLTVRL